ncbi:hypothetical protein [Methylobacter tundripaludum]|uniref:hypothetical protein n=1 Tax=Methylobacter tundripaludum TaxID=173365 RepID=UPI0012378BB8|nr:hypothetical protein [Methylobacter tundripaludum]
MNLSPWRTTKGQIMKLVNNDGGDNLDGYPERGACDALILELLAEYTADCGILHRPSLFD